jgi:hypothetical protein
VRFQADRRATRLRQFVTDLLVIGWVPLGLVQFGSRPPLRVRRASLATPLRARPGGRDRLALTHQRRPGLIVARSPSTRWRPSN